MVSVKYDSGSDELRGAMDPAKAVPDPNEAMVAPFRKDAALDRLARVHNVAQFVSFAPGGGSPVQQFCRLSDTPPNYEFPSPRSALEALLARASGGALNVRSYSESRPQSREFIYGLSTVDSALSAVKRLSEQGDFTIVNETIDISDGGVSGVAMGDLVEFRPDATPRGVEQSGFASLPRAWAQSILQAVYGFEVDLAAAAASRVEFSIHPQRRGWKQSHTLFWEIAPLRSDEAVMGDIHWPNDFSRMTGDKVYGLLVAWAAGFRVPHSTVVSRRLAPFSFGMRTGTGEQWIRTSPVEQVPGRFTTALGWRDPFRLLATEDPNHDHIASVISQEAITPGWSGAAIEDSAGELIVEGVAGTGDDFMVGRAPLGAIPNAVRHSIRQLHTSLRASMGAVRFEWVFDGRDAWIVQLHRGTTESSGTTIVPGEAAHWRNFIVSDGLERLRKLVTNLQADEGILFVGEVGLTSHMADVVRKSGVPSRMTGT